MQTMLAEDVQVERTGEALASPVVSTSCDAEDIRDDAREKARKSLAFLLTRGLGLRVDASLTTSLQKMKPSELRLLADGIAVFAELRLRKPHERPDALRWLFPEVHL